MWTNRTEKVNWKAKHDETENLTQKMYFRGTETKCIGCIDGSSCEQYKEKGLCCKIQIGFFREHNEIWRKDCP